MSWRVAESLETLRKQLNTAFPKRSKVSDGSIGDAKHASRNSDHNPYIKDKNNVGVVTARDFTHDPKNGLDCHWLAKKLVESRDERIKYIIWNKQILSSKNSAWQWRQYKGVNGHTQHLHLSVHGEQNLYDDKSPWDLDIALMRDFADLKDDEIKLKIPQISSVVEKIKETPKGLEPVPEIAPDTQAVETTQEVTAQTKTGEVTQTSQVINEQPVNQTVTIPEPEPQGIFKKLTGGVTALLSGTFLVGVFEKFGNITLSQTVLILLIVAIVIGFIGFCFWAWLDAWKTKNRLVLLVEAQTRTDRKDLEFVEKGK